MGETRHISQSYATAGESVAKLLCEKLKQREFNGEKI